MMEFRISTERDQLDVEYIHRVLQQSYWAEGIPKSIVEDSIANSLCFGVFSPQRQIGFGRVITDYATFGFLSDVFIDQEFRGQGLGKMLVGEILSHPALKRLRRWHLITRDAQGLYRHLGFTEVECPEQHMEIRYKDIYIDKSSG